MTKPVHRPVLTDDRPLWMKRAWWLSAYLASAGMVALRRDWPLWPRKGQRPESEGGTRIVDHT